VPVWNKSNREHLIAAASQGGRRQGRRRVRDLSWTTPYHVDADHINLGTVDRFLDERFLHTRRGQRSAAVDDDVRPFVARHPSCWARSKRP
jgi:hypothetical protein